MTSKNGSLSNKDWSDVCASTSPAPRVAVQVPAPLPVVNDPPVVVRRALRGTQVHLDGASDEFLASVRGEWTRTGCNGRLSNSMVIRYALEYLALRVPVDAVVGVVTAPQDRDAVVSRDVSS